jgi:hypothetical protein
MTQRDDMVLRPGADKRRGLRDRIREARKNNALQKTRQQLTQMAASRSRAQEYGRRKVKNFAKERGWGSYSKAAKLGAKILSASALVTEGVMFAGETARRLQGMSGRRIQAMDLATMYGDLVPQSRAAASVRGQIEGDREFLRIIGREGKVNSQFKQRAEIMRQMELKIQRGAFAIEQGAAFDSADSMVDKAIASLKEEAREKLAEKLRGAVRMVKELGIARGGAR